MFEIPLIHNWCLNFDSDGNSNSSPNAYFRFSNFPYKSEIKDKKWQCSQNPDWNPNCFIRMNSGSTDTSVKKRHHTHCLSPYF